MLSTIFFTISFILIHLLYLDASPDIEVPSGSRATSFPHSLRDIKLLDLDEEPIGLISLEVLVQDGTIDHLESFPGLWIRQQGNKTIITGIAPDIQKFLDRGKLMMLPPTPRWLGKASVYLKVVDRNELILTENTFHVIIDPDVKFEVQISPHYLSIDEDQSFLFEEFNLTLLSSADPTEIISCEIDALWGELTGIHQTNVSTAKLQRMFPSYSYRPKAHFSGLDTVDLRCETIGGESDNAKFDIEIDPINDYPEIFLGSAIVTGEEDVPISLSKTGLRFYDADIEGGQEVFIAVDLELRIGRIELPPVSLLGGLSSIINSPNRICLSGELNRINSAIRNTAIVFPINWHGTDVLSVNCTDNIEFQLMANTSVVETWQTASVSFFVDNVNDPPTISVEPKIVFDMNKGNTHSLCDYISLSDVDGMADENYIFSISLSVNEKTGKSSGSIVFDAPLDKSLVTAIRKEDDAVEVYGSSIIELSKFVKSMHIVFDENSSRAPHTVLNLLLSDTYGTWTSSADASITIIENDKMSKIQNETNLLITDDNFSWSNGTGLEKLTNSVNKSPFISYPIVIDKFGLNGTHFLELNGLSVKDDDEEQVLIVSMVLSPDQLGRLKQNIITDVVMEEDEVIPGRYKIVANEKMLNKALSSLVVEVNGGFSGEGDLSVQVFDSAGSTSGIVIDLLVTKQVGAPILVVHNRTLSVLEDNHIELKALCYFDHGDATLFRTERFEVKIETEKRQGSVLAGTFQFHLKQIVGGIHFPLQDITAELKESFVMRGSLDSLNNALEQMVLIPPTNFYGEVNIKVEVRGGNLTGYLGTTFNIAIVSLDDSPLILWFGDEMNETVRFVEIDEDKVGLIEGITVEDPDVNSGNVSATLRTDIGHLCYTDKEAKRSSVFDSDTFTYYEGKRFYCPKDGQLLSFTNNIYYLNELLQSIMYVPSENWWGRDIVSIEVDSQNKKCSGEINVIVAAADDNPTIFIPESPFKSVGAKYIINGIKVYDPDIDQLLKGPNGLCLSTPSVCHMTIEVTSRYGVVTVKDLRETSSHRSNNGKLLIRGTLDAINRSFEQVIYTQLGNHGGTEILNISVTDREGNQDLKAITLALHPNHRAPIISILVENNFLEMEEDQMVKIGNRDNCDDFTDDIFSCQVININDCDNEERLLITLESHNGLMQTPELLSISKAEVSFNDVSPKDFVDMIEIEAQPHILNRILGRMYFKPSHNFNSINGRLASIFITVTAKKGLIARNKLNIYVKSSPDKPVIELDPQFDGDGNNTVLVEKNKSTKLWGIRVYDADSTHQNHLLQTNLSVTKGYVCIIGKSYVRQWILGYRNQCLRNVIFQNSVDATNKIFQELIYRPEKQFVGDDSFTVHISDFSNKGYHDEEVLNMKIRVLSEDADPRIIGPEIIQIKEDETVAINVSIQTDNLWLSSEIFLSISSEHGTLHLPVQTDLSIQSSTRSVIGNGTVKAWNNALSRMTYKPDENWNSYYGAFEVIDVTLFDTKRLHVRNSILKHKIFISVEATPDAPTWNMIGKEKVDSTLLVHKDTEHKFVVYDDESIPIFLSLNDPDVVEEYSDPLLTVHASSAAGGCIQLYSSDGLFLDEEKNKCELIQIKGTLKQINAAMTQIRYTPPLHYYGRDTVSLFASDGLLNVTATIIVLVTTRLHSFPSVFFSSKGQCVDYNMSKRETTKISNEKDLELQTKYKELLYRPNRRGRIVNLSEDLSKYKVEEETPIISKCGDTDDSRKSFRCRPHDLCSVGNFSIEGDESVIYKLEVSVTLGSIISPTHLLDIDSTYLNQMQTRLQMIGNMTALNKALPHLKYKPRVQYQGVDTMFFILSSLSIPVIFDSFLSSSSVDIIVEAENDRLTLVAPSNLLFMNEDEISSIEGTSAHKRSSTDDQNKVIQVSIMASTGYVRLSRGLAKVKIHSESPNYDEIWWNNIAICGAIDNVNSSLGKISFKPVENWNSDSGDVAYVTLHMAGLDDCTTVKSIGSLERSDDDSVLIPIYVKAVNDRPLLSLKTSPDNDVISTENHTLFVEENSKIHIPMSVQDIDSDLVKVEIKSRGSGMIAVFLDNLKNIDAFFLEGDCGGDFYPHVGIQGTIPGVNIVLQNIYFMGKETNEYLEIIASDLIGGQDTLALTIYVQPVVKELLLWFVVNPDFHRPIPIFQEKETRLIGSDWVQQKDLYMEAEIPKHLVGPKYKVRRLSGPRIFTVSIGSDEDTRTSDERVCVKVVTDQGIIRIQEPFKSISFETAIEGKELRYIGDVSSINKASEAIIFNAVEGSGGKVTLDITAIKGHCEKGTNSCYCNFDLPDARHGFFHIQVNRLNSAPRISWLTNDYMAMQPLTSKLDSRMTLQGLHIQDLDASQGGILTVKITASKGVVSLLSIQGLSFTKGRGFHDRHLEVLGTLHAINEAIHELIYTCRALIDGCQAGSQETIHLKVNDNGFNGYGLAKEDESILHIQII